VFRKIIVCKGGEVSEKRRILRVTYCWDIQGGIRLDGLLASVLSLLNSPLTLIGTFPIAQALSSDLLKNFLGEMKYRQQRTGENYIVGFTVCIPPNIVIQLLYKYCSCD
jgi:hypothetical protein